MAETRVLIHIGPHKTGSTAIQHLLARNRDLLGQHGVEVLHDRDTQALALDLANRNFDSAKARLAALKSRIEASSAEVVILSQEDFAGDLLGRSRSMRVYPTLTKNIRILQRELRPFRSTFLFFLRPEEDWLYSCYLQHLKHRSRFSAFEDFIAAVEDEFDWTKKLQPVREAVGDELLVIDYSKAPGDGIAALLGAAGVPADMLGQLDTKQPQQNVSLSPEEQRQFELINRLSFVRPLIPTYKARLREGRTHVVSSGSVADAWPPQTGDVQAPSLEALSRRVQGRVSSQPDQPDVLPPEDVDLDRLLDARLPGDADLPEQDRRDIQDQAAILKYHLRDRSELAYLNALCISYLRRDTPWTGKARTLFHRIWSEQGHLLVAELSTRWLISVLQTFYDHPNAPAQRVVGAAGYFYANMLKIYEGERNLEGLPADAIYPGLEPSSDNGFRGLDRYAVGGTDLLLNTNAMALEVASLDPHAGLVLEEFLLRTRRSKTVFSRNDATRTALGLKDSNFADTWTFFEPPT